ncbi:MAG TPA: CoA transferase [Acidimicrobiales bacterium]|nr:CoA transferase [Acidimicrobiales bacterium]
MGEEPWPLRGVRVLDLSTGIAGGYCTKLLADAGAAVVKVEPPSGDPLRRYGAGPEPGLLYEFLRTSKRTEATDEPATAEDIRGRYAWADLVVESFEPGVIEARGLGYEVLAAINPRASLISISSFGRGGPWSNRPATEFTLIAQAGSTATRGLPGRPFINAGGRIGEWMAGVSAAVAAAAVWHRSVRTGHGDHVDLSALEAITPTCTNVQTVWGSLSGEYESEPRLEIPSIEPTSDGYVGFCIFTGQQWQDFCLLIGQPELAEDPDLATMGGRIANGRRVLDLVRGYTTARTTAEVVDEAVLLRIPVAPIGTGATIPSFDQFTARGVYVNHPSGRFVQPRVPYRVSGHDTRPFALEPDLGDADPVATTLDATADPDAWPLAGVRVLDLTAFWAGPYATFALACLGADVIHVESVQRPDGMRFGSARPPGTDRWWEWGPTFHAANAGKRSITLDLTRPEGRDLLRRLVEVSDVLVENFSPRVIEQFGCTWDVLHEWNPRLVMVRMPAFGLDGPWRDRVGFAQTMEQISGMAWLTGYADGEPMNARGPCDPLAGLHSAFAAIVGLEVRRRHGLGVHIESTMVETALNAAAEQVIEHSATGYLMTRDGNHHPGNGPHGVYLCADRPPGTMGAVAVAVDTAAQREALGAIVGASIPSGADAFDALLAPWCAARGVSEVVDTLIARGVPAAPVVAVRCGDQNPQVQARGFYEAPRHPVTGTHAIGAFPVVFGRQPARRFARPAPTLGEHNAEILGGLLGLSDAELAALREQRIIGDRPVGL